MAHKIIIRFFLFFIFFFLNLIFSQDPSKYFKDKSGTTFKLYPYIYDKKPATDSPIPLANGMEVLLVHLKSNKYALIPVTVENGEPLHYSKRVRNLFGKDKQLQVDSGDFPILIRTGLHSESDLEGKEIITGYPVSLINYIGRPGRFSGAGFIAHDEDVISVLKCDNRLVKKLDLTHPQMAKPLFHLWNIILKEIEIGKWGRFYDNIQYILYNNKTISLKTQGMKGWQISIFQDEIQGRFDIGVSCELSSMEKSFLKESYPLLSTEQMTEFQEKLSSIHFSEMVPYYIMRYGFYEGHTDYRSDPVAIAFIFGLKSLEKIENIFQGNLYKILTNHFTTATVNK